MYNLLCPHVIADSLYDINTDKLEKNNIHGLIFDLDNTIIPWDSPDINPEVEEWLNSLLKRGFKICLVSNNMAGRVGNVAARLNIPFVSRAYKPAKNGFRQASAVMKLSPSEVAVIGDQLFTDILGGNRLGMFTIWVKPLSTREFLGTKITRQIERVAVRILKAKGLLK